MKLHNILSRILDGLILLVFILFFSSAGFQDRNTSGWYQQWFPNLNGSTIKDITFLDSLTGFAVTNPGTSIYCYILKTSNGGDNWVINYTYNSGANIRFTRIQFADNNTGYVSTNFYNFFKTTDSGLTWTDYPNVPFGAEDMSVVNKDSILVVTSRGLGGGVYRSTNGGISWQYIWTNGTSGNPDKIYMYDKNMGFICSNPQDPQFKKTVNGGLNWFDVNSDAFLDIKFLDTLTGWKGRNNIKKTTNGGLNWIVQVAPNVTGFNVYSIAVINKDTVWLGGHAFKIFGNTYYGALCKTTNGGTNWGYQIPNMEVDSGMYENVNFINKNNGWAYINSTPGFNDGVHTKVGGHDTTVYTSINNSNIEITDFRLFQNYPNPFNSSTIIRYQVKANSNVSIKVYDVQGHEVQTLVQWKLIPGVYEYIFNGSYLSSGIYFYSMITDGKAVDTKRMIYLK